MGKQLKGRLPALRRIVVEVLQYASNARASAIAALDAAADVLPTSKCMAADICGQAVEAANAAVAKVNDLAALFSRNPGIEGSSSPDLAAMQSQSATFAALAAEQAAIVKGLFPSSTADLVPPVAMLQVPSLMRLTHLSLDDNKMCPLDDAALIVLRRSFPHLMHLSLRGCGPATVWRTHSLAAWAPLLGVGAASDSSASCRGLRELDIGFNNSVPSDVIEAMRAYCPLFCSHSGSPPFE